jgi:hypothetical protein
MDHRLSPGEHVISQAAVRIWVRENVDKPYVRGSAGPAGFDCSGFVEAWQRAFGDPETTLPNPKGD